jgi:membrane-associated phospholipid phosphatase
MKHSAPVAAKQGGILPPWGLMDEALLEDISQRPIPKDWKPANGSQVTPAKWQQWRDEVISEIAGVLWPVYVPGSVAWQSPAVQALINVDFALLKRLHPAIHAPIRALHPTTVTHLDFFLDEDDESKLFATGYERYDPRLPAELRAELQKQLEAGLQSKVATLDLQMKQAFLRPRAYQVAVIQQRREYGHLEAKTANTPSMVSGHCLQSIMGACNVFNELADRLNHKSLDVFRQFAVDIGDRRVLAGVHYPSDSLSSWYTSFRLIPFVFPRSRVQAIRGFLWQAISRKSLVFETIQKHVRSVSNSPYQKAVAALRAVAG